MRYNFERGVLATTVLSGVVSVQCPNCLDTIGTMTPDMVQTALELTSGRGGVLCPRCRETTCDSCGLVAYPDEPRLYRIDTDGKPRRLCWLCCDEFYWGCYLEEVDERKK